MDSPGWFPLRDPERAWTSVLRRAGYFTGYVTDNPYLASRTRTFRCAARLICSRGTAARSVARTRVFQAAAQPLAVPGAEQREGGRPRALPRQRRSRAYRGRDVRRRASPASRRSSEPRSGGRSRSSSTRSLRTSPGRRRGRYLDMYGDLTGADLSRARCATGASRTGWTRTRRRASSSGCGRSTPPR